MTLETEHGLDEALASAALTPAEAALLEHIASATYPIGARVAHRHLVESGHDISEGSVSRILARFDGRGLTEEVGRKGRVATPIGQRLGRYITDVRRRNAAYERAIDVRTIEQLYDLLYARRGIESETARAAAVRSTESDLGRLEELVHTHRVELAAGHVARKCAMTFHREIARLSGNPLLMAVSETVLNERLDYLERVLDVVTARHRSLDRSADEHGDIFRAIADRRADDAYATMHGHLTRLIREVREFVDENGAPVFSSVLDLAQS